LQGSSSCARAWACSWGTRVAVFALLAAAALAAPSSTPADTLTPPSLWTTSSQWFKPNPPAPSQASLRRAMAQQRRQMARQRAWLRSPRARAQRIASAHRYRGLSGPQAISAARKHFAIGKPLWQPAYLRLGDHVVGWIGDNAALIDRAGRKGRAIVESLIPLWSPDDAGNSQRVSLDLEDRGAAYEPTNPLVKTSIGKGAADGLSLPDVGLNVRPLDLANVPASIVGGRAFYANAAADTDWMIAPIPTGAEVFWQLRSPASPESLSLEVSLPSGASMTADPAGGIDVVHNEQLLARISRVVATDAQGRQLTASYSVSGDRISFRIPHRGGGYAYPILVDPVVDSDISLHAGGWRQDANYWSGFFTGFGTGPYGWGQYITSQAGINYPQYALARFIYQAPGIDSYIYNFAFGGLNLDLTDPYACWQTGIARWDLQAWQGGSNSAPGSGPMTICGPNGLRGGGGWYSWDGGHKNWAVNQLFYSINRTPGTGSQVYLGGATVSMADDNNARISHVPPAPGGWTTNNQISDSIIASDDGLGVKDIQATVNSGSVQTWDSGCDGTAAHQCSGSYQVPFSQTLPEGFNVIAYQAHDILGQTTGWGSATVAYPVDRTPPNLTLSGPLWERRYRTVAEPWQLVASAKDGSTGLLADERSGVKNVQIQVKAGATSSTNPYSTVASTGDQTCVAPEGSCSRSLTWTLDPNTWAAGTYTVRVTATDELGQVTPETLNNRFEVTVGTGKLVDLREGQESARRVRLKATSTRSDQTGVRIEFRRSATASWQTVPVGNVTQGRGAAVGSWPLALDSQGNSPDLVWDVAATPGVDYADGDVQVRAAFTGGSAPGTTQDVIFKLDQTGLGTGGTVDDIGPGQVDLLAGNFSVSATDADIASPLAGLSVARTYNSRSSTGANGPLGSGWTLGLPAESAQFVKLRNVTELIGGDGWEQNYVIVTTLDGDDMTFAEQADANGQVTYASPPSSPDLTLKAVHNANNPSLIDEFDLTDGAGTKSVFTPSGSGNYGLDHVDQPGSSGRTTYSLQSWAGAPAGVRVTRELAPTPTGVDCTTLVAGCRALIFVYAPSTTSPPAAGSVGDYPDRLQKVTFSAPPAAAVDVTAYSYDSNGRLARAWDPRISPALQTAYTYDSSGLLSSLTPPGEKAWSFQYLTQNSGDTGVGRLQSVRRPTLNSDGSTGPDAQTTVAYGVPLSGSGLPDLTPGASASWGQNDIPQTATAVFPPDQVPGNPVTSYSRATISYLNAEGNEVNQAEPGGAISTTERDIYGNVTRDLTAVNRDAALATGSTTQEHADRAALLDTQRTYSADGADLIDEFGPVHAIAGGNSARRHRHIDYDQYKPDGQDYHLPTTETIGSRLVGANVDTDQEKRTTAYDWSVRRPTTTTVDPDGHPLVTRMTYDAQGRLTSKSLPNDSTGTTAGTEHFWYFPVTTTAGNPCSAQPQWAGMLCRTDPAKDPSTQGRMDPALPRTSYTYTSLGQRATVSDTVAGGATRTTTTSYDPVSMRAMGRSITSTGADAGASVADVTWNYDSSTGRQTSASANGRTVTTTFDSLGRVSRYQDADGSTTSTDYDTLDRATKITVKRPDGSTLATQDLSYNNRDLLSQIVDSQFGTLTGTYDTNDDLLSETFPGGLNLFITRSETGAETGRCYTKSTTCSSSAWINATGTKTIQDRWAATNTTGQGSRSYSYDAAGRLTRTADTQTGVGCSLRTYLYDDDSNRTSVTKWEPLSDGSCESGATGGTTVTHSYDTADRLVDSGYSYDSFGRTLTVPAGDAGGRQLTSTYYVNDRAQSVKQDNITTTFLLDPTLRTRVRQVSGSADEIQHYGDDSDDPIYTEQGSDYEREISGLDGDLIGSYSSADGAQLSMTDLHGDVVGEAPATTSATQPTSRISVDEFGIPSTSGRGTQVRKGSYAAQVLATAGLGSYWRVGEPSGAAADSGPNGVALQPSGTITRQITPPLKGDSNGGATLASGAGFADNSDHDSLDIRTGSKSWELWFKTSDTAQATLLRKSDANGANGISLTINKVTAGKVTVSINGTDFITASPTVNDGQWHHLAVSLNRTSQTLTAIIDGVSSGTASTTALGSADLNAAAALQVGGIAGSPFTGSVDDVALYDQALALSDVQQHYAAAKSYQSLVLQTQNLGSYWRLGEASGSAADTGPDALSLDPSGAITRAVAGALKDDSNGAATFASGARFADAADHSALDIHTGSKSWEFWLKTSQTTEGTVLRKSDTNGANGVTISVNRGTAGRITVGINGTDYLTGTATVNNGQWHHVLIALDRTAKTVTEYVDGVAAGSASVNTLKATTDLDATSPLQVPGGVALAGSVDEVAIYNRALTATEALLHNLAGRQAGGDSAVAGRYGWIGAKQRPTVTTTGVIAMGARLYQPQLGRFLQVDPVDGGSANPYDYAFQDPLNQFDESGEIDCPKWIQIALTTICIITGDDPPKPADCDRIDPDDPNICLIQPGDGGKDEGNNGEKAGATSKAKKHKHKKRRRHHSHVCPGARGPSAVIAKVAC
jgi:RHS repeat-associated protein